MRTSYLYVIAILGAALAIRSKIVWENCGYDCGITTVEGPLVAVGGWYVGLAVTIISVLIIVVKMIKRGGTTR